MKQMFTKLSEELLALKGVTIKEDGYDKNNDIIGFYTFKQRKETFFSTSWCRIYNYSFALEVRMSQNVQLKQSLKLSRVHCFRGSY